MNSERWGLVSCYKSSSRAYFLLSPFQHKETWEAHRFRILQIVQELSWRKEWPFLSFAVLIHGKRRRHKSSPAQIHTMGNEEGSFALWDGWGDSGQVVVLCPHRRSPSGACRSNSSSVRITSRFVPADLATFSTRRQSSRGSLKRIFRRSLRTSENWKMWSTFISL